MAVWPYRRSILAITEFSVGSGVVLSLIGGLVGAFLLLHTPATPFANLVPSLILFATVVFAVGNLVPLHVIQRVRIGREAPSRAFHYCDLRRLFRWRYRFLMLAAFTLFGMRDINAMNGLNWLSSAL